ncbi:hypothetical protein EGH24_10140 [Halonotius terrestris]|uniref:SHOCT domain-containing protein n=1 Tax=Halonotius terrestris TaxID=2487750 RepID=A0A8J8PB56_9EURY|nr:SHOCT domain-containing protein [Halonotius terrestris]TQQ79841.1 hypothetical protein EGH24_10140 [Halonotius terrestris]
MSASDGRTDADDETHSTSATAGASTALLVGGGLLVVLTVLLVILSIAPSGGMGGGMMGGGMMGGGMGGPWLWLLATVLPLSILTVVGYALWQSTQASTPQATEPESTADPLEILETRYLDDEIDLAEYETRLGHLFGIDADGDSHPRVSRLAIRYARGEIDRETLTARLDRLQSADASVGAVDTETVVQSAAALDRQDTHSATTRDNEQSTATERLRQRYADGGVSHEEYKQRLRTLRETASEET